MGSAGNPLVARLIAKKKLMESIVGGLKPGEREEAEKDHHAVRPPRPCGMTIHTGIGCSMGCIYCYIYDMGFPGRVTPYPLSPRQLVYALLRNPYFIPGHEGTLVAIGSVTEPFLPETKEKAMAYIEAIARNLGNPIQFSTKAVLTYSDAERLRRADPGISPLVTIITMRWSSVLEPNAPPPEERFETIRMLRKTGLKPILFLRPIIPGITDDEAPEILREARRSGAAGVVLGGLRVTRGIITRLEAAGINTREIKRRLPRKPRGREQVPIRIRDIKEMLAREAERRGLYVFPQACMANLYTHGRRCHHMAAIKGLRGPRDPDPGEIRGLAKHLGLRLIGYRATPRGLFISLRGRRREQLVFEENIRTYYSICVRRT